MTFKKLHIILMIAVVIVIGINIYFMPSRNLIQEDKQEIAYIPGVEPNISKIEDVESGQNIIEISKDCVSDLDCSWKITNCCSENDGGQWQCISKKSKIECNELVLCPQVVSPKPEQSCSCIQGSCASG